MSRGLQIYPYVNPGDGWSISDSAMAAIWMQLEMEDKVEDLFYDGSIRDVTGWLTHIKQPGLFLAVVADPDKGIPVHVCWLKDVYDGVAWAHHTALGRYRRGAAEAIIDYWRQFPLRLLLGMTPETNKLAVKFLEKICKFTIVGTIPEVCNLAYESKRVGGVISYLLIQKEQEQWVEKVEEVRAAVA